MGSIKNLIIKKKLLLASKFPITFKRNSEEYSLSFKHIEFI